MSLYPCPFKVPLIFSTGTDEHGLKVAQAAERAGEEPRAFCDRVSGEFRSVFDRCGVSYSSFLRTSSVSHMHTVQAVWRELERRGQLYQASYQGWYCTREEAFIPASQVSLQEEGRAVSTETGSRLERSSETNYMFRLSSQRERLLQWLDKEDPVQPPLFRGQVLAWLQDEDMQDVSVSRPKERVPWGVQVPGDSSHTVYVWLDALCNYLTVTQGHDSPPSMVHVIGKDILKFHAVYWPALLSALSLPLPSRIQVHSHWTVEGVKMSKSLGNVVDPKDLISKYSVDGVRYFLLREGVPEHDGDFSEARMVNVLNVELADTLGNLLNRATSAKINTDLVFPKPTYISDESSPNIKLLMDKLLRLQPCVSSHFDNFHFHSGICHIMEVLRLSNLIVQEEQPWKLKSLNPERLNLILYLTLECLRISGILLQPIVPTLAGRLLDKLSIHDQYRHFDEAFPNAEFQVYPHKISPEKIILFNKFR